MNKRNASSGDGGVRSFVGQSMLQAGLFVDERDGCDGGLWAPVIEGRAIIGN